MNNSELRVFYGTSDPVLGEKIVKYLGLNPGKIKISRFAGGERKLSALPSNFVFVMIAGPVTQILASQPPTPACWAVGCVITM